jgi:CubicO group peptidase (beta-lactamase class C family)
MEFDADGDAGRRLDAFLRRVAREDRLPGISAAVVDRDGERYATGIGARDVAGNRPATPDTLYGVGSVTKPVTATAVLQLADAGLCTVDDPIGDHLDIDLDPDAADDTGGSAPEPIRIRHLLTHTAGYPSLGTSEALIARRLRVGGGSVPLADRADLYAHLENAAGERIGPPGERRAYWNAGYGLLGDLIETVTGKPYPEYVEEHVLAPLAADRATFDDTAFATDDDHMTQYLLEDGEPTVASLPARDMGRAAGGLLASVRDLGGFLRAQLNDGAADDGRLLPAARAAQLHEPRVDTPEGRYGYGWLTRETCGRQLVGVRRLLPGRGPGDRGCRQRDARLLARPARRGRGRDRGRRAAGGGGPVLAAAAAVRPADGDVHGLPRRRPCRGPPSRRDAPAGAARPA